MNAQQVVSNSINTLSVIKVTDFFPVVFRYIVLVALLFIIFFFFKRKSIRFILFIVIFIINFFTFVFLYRDLIATNLVSDIFHPTMSFNLQNSKSVFIKIFVGTIFLTLLLQVSSIAIMLVVFDYGKRFTHNFYSANMTSPNVKIVDEYLVWLRRYFIIVGVLSYILAISYTKNERIRNLLINIGCLLPVGFLLGSSIYGTVLAVKFLNVKKHHRALYK
jgi:hypothetical protein